MSEAKKLHIIGTFAPKEISADKIVFPDGLKTTYEVGKIHLENGVGTLIEPGGTLDDFFDVFVEDRPPSVTQPTLSVETTSYGTWEVGSTHSWNIKATLNPGEYEYESETGVTVTNMDFVITSNGNPLNIYSGPVYGDEYSYGGYVSDRQLVDGDKYEYVVTATYSDGMIPKTNLGNDCPEQRILAGSVSYTESNKLAHTSYRDTFYGTLTEKSELTSEIIRKLPYHLGYENHYDVFNSTKFVVNVPIGALRVVVAYPAYKRDASYIRDLNAMRSNIINAFRVETINVEGAEGYTAIPYKVYILDFARPNDVENEFEVTI